MTKRIIRIVLEVLSLLILLGTIVFLVAYWKDIPAQVPNRLDSRSEITEWADKKVLFVSPVLMTITFVGLFFAKTVRFRSLGKTVRAPAPALMFPAMKLPLLLGLSYITVCSALVRPLDAWFFPVFFVLLFAPMIVFGIMLLCKGKK